MSNNIFKKLAKFQQSGFIKYYIKKNLKIYMRVDTIIQENLNDLFFGGVKYHIQHVMHMFNPTSINEFVLLVHGLEDKF